MWGVICVISSFCLSAILTEAKFVDTDYKKQREELLQKEFERSLGGNLVLSEDEKTVNDILMYWKNKELDECFRNPDRFNLSKSYFTYRDYINKSNVYKIIRRMPKGGALHIHSSLMLDADGLVKLTYEDHLYCCYEGDDLKLQFSEVIPERPCTDKWSLVSDLRNASDDVIAFDNELRKHFIMYGKGDYNSSGANDSWTEFNRVFRITKSLNNYIPARKKYFYAGLKNFYEDNVMYMEIRSTAFGIFEFNSTYHSGMYLLNLYQEITENFKKDHPDFYGIKFILTSHRDLDTVLVRQNLNLTRQIKKEMPEMYAGFDLVGREDSGKTLLDRLPELAEMKNEINYYFHAGETVRYGTTSDENLIDAILLGTRRIGHGYALLKHPNLLSIIQQKDIAIEVNVISNNVLSLVSDVRNHPLATYLALGLPVVLSSDDPGVWGADPLSHDFYVTFVGVASKRSDLRLLKQLAINSIKYSALDDKGKTNLFRIFNSRWSNFIQEIIQLNARGEFNSA